MEYKTVLDIDKDNLTSCPNIAELLSDFDLNEIGGTVVNDFETDLLSRSDWERKMEQAMKLALQVVEQKSFPWQGASNVKFPLLTIAALQYHARAYPNLIEGTTPVKCRVFGKDADKKKAMRAERIEDHMAYQILEEDLDWESEMDKVLITQPIIGCAFKKTYFDPLCKHNISESVFVRDFVVNYWTKSLDTAPRISHVLYFQKNEIYERVVRGLWLDIDEDDRPNQVTQTEMAINQDRAQGLTPPEGIDTSNPYVIIEQHRGLDLDCDGYDEPYIVWVRKDTKKVVRIAARYTESNIERATDGTILSIKGETYFTKYPFIPSPDGGFYDLGFGVLLGPLNGSIDTAINQLIDAGTMANTAGGFLGRGVKIRGGNQTFQPLEWKHVDSTGDDLNKNIFPLPVREPSKVLMELLKLLINYGERIGMSVDIMVGENPGQNTPAQTTQTMVEQGSKILTGIYKRTYRALRDEFRKWYRLNQLYLPDDAKFEDGKMCSWEDYTGDPNDICPAADPNLLSDGQRLLKAKAVLDAAHTMNGFNQYEATKRWLKALKEVDIDTLYPDPQGPNAVPPMPNPKIIVAQIAAQGKQAVAELQFKKALLELQLDAELTQAKITELEAKAEFEKAQAQGVVTGHQIALIEAQIGAEKAHKDTILKSVDTMTKLYEAMQPKDVTADQPGKVPGGL